MARNKHPEETVELILTEAMKLFAENGYDNTSIQDIINNLGGLSKGAIYHHFKSKEDIFEAVCRKIDEHNTSMYIQIRDDNSKNGFEKLKAMLSASASSPTTPLLVSLIQKIMSEPRFLNNQITEIFELVSPHFVQPVIEQGIADGSIKTAYPRELSESILTLTNIWMNPIINKAPPEDIVKRLCFFKELLLGIGLDIFEEGIIEKYSKYLSSFPANL